MLDIAPPMLGLPGGLITLFLAAGALTSYANEANPQTRVPYSKFFHDDASKQQQPEKTPPAEVSSKTGMTMIYGLPFSAAVLSLAITQAATLAGILVVIHFAKRLLEVQFVHSYSGGMARDTGLMIGTYYSLVAVLICSLATGTPTEASAIWGTSLFTIGSFGNLYHHILLARLRNNKTTGSKSYSVPSGGLFEYAAAPHYLFELMAWLGIAVASQHANVFLVFAAMSSYLAGRSVSQNDWNRQKFQEEWPVDRKNMIPYLF